MSLIEIKKIVKEDQRDNSGNIIKVPGTDNTIKVYTTKRELINTDLIKSAREWKKKGNDHNGVPGDMTILYMKSGDPDAVKRGSKNPEILIAENYLKFGDRSGAKMLPNDK